MASDFQIKFHREASEELERAKAWYEQQRAGLGEAFLHEVESAISRIRDNPTTWPCYPGKDTQRYILHRFPFGIVYQRQSQIIRVLAVMHLKREPGYWKRRAYE
ncbi:MAG: type II toxin-antitoxin system RelE/ParE family toxin [Nitrospirota bacterium]